jgi:hypothetical protein
LETAEEARRATGEVSQPPFLSPMDMLLFLLEFLAKASPRKSSSRGGKLILDHPHGQTCFQIIEKRKVI